jgi:predicted acetyltransferase
VVADDGGLVVGHAGAQTRDLTVPGAVVPAAHVTAVGVAPTHRRRGVLTAMMRHQLTAIAEAGREPVAALWASETAIYPRYGYGGAAERMSLDVLTREVRITVPVPPAGQLRLVEPSAATAELAAVYDRVRPGRVGWSSRPEHLWRHRLLDVESMRHGATNLHAVVCDGPDGPVGYALWRVAEAWNQHGPDAEVRIVELVAADTPTYAALWQFLLGIDLARRARYDHAAFDEPLQYMVDEPRRLGRSQGDGLWVRLVDLPAALEARHYLGAVDVVLDVTDPILERNTGRWRLSGGSGKVTCTRTDEPADLACSITDLGAAYLGGTSLAALAAAGRVRRLTGNLPAQAFGWDRQPHPIEVF